MLALVGDQHLVGEAVVEQRIVALLQVGPIEDGQRPLANVAEVAPELIAAE